MVVLRLLKPEDYGLMTMAAILTAYMEIFSEFGLGSAIVQKKEITQKNLSSIFWFSLGTGLLLSISCFALAYPTSYIMKEPRTIPVTFLIAPLFIIGSTMTVPFNLLKRDFGFKKIGIINIISMLVSNAVIIPLALNGFGVYTLIIGVITLRITKVLGMFIASKWRPSLHYSFQEAKPFLRFGINLAGSSSLLKIFETLDKVIVGRFFNATFVGFYGYAVTFASFPLDKIWPIFQQILFPLFSRYQDNEERCHTLFLQVTRYYSLIMIPLFISCFFFGAEIVLTIGGPTWAPAIPFFKAFSIAKLFDSLCEMANLLHTAKGRTYLLFRLSIVKTILMPLAIFFAARHSFAALTIPWMYLYSLICLSWIIFTLHRNVIPIREYFSKISSSLFVSVAIIAAIYVVRFLIGAIHPTQHSYHSDFFQMLITGSIIFGAYIFLFEKQSFRDLKKLMGK